MQSEKQSAIMQSATGTSFRIPIDFSEKEVFIMIDLIHKIDAFIEKIEGASIWGYVNSVIDKVKKLLDYEGDTDAVQFIEIMTK